MIQFSRRKVAQMNPGQLLLVSIAAITLAGCKSAPNGSSIAKQPSLNFLLHSVEAGAIRIPAGVSDSLRRRAVALSLFLATLFGLHI